MGYERPVRRKPEKKHVLGGDIDNRRFAVEATGLTLPMKVLLLPSNGSFYGAASIYNTKTSRKQGIVYWNNLLRERHVIIPIENADISINPAEENTLRVGKAYFLTINNGGKVCKNPDLSKTNRAKLDCLVEQAAKELKTLKQPEIRPVSAALKGNIRKAFPDKYVGLIEVYFKAVKYKSHTVNLPLNQNH